MPRITFYAKAFDFWIGAFLDIPKRRLYLQPLPCLGVRLDFGREP